MRFEDVDSSEPTDGMARIAIKASAINYFDALLVAGQYQTKPDLPFVPGVEVSGVIEFAPAGSSLNKGDRVTALLDSGGLTRGGYAEIADALPAAINRLPDAMPFDDAAAFTLIFQTAWFGLHRRANLHRRRRCHACAVRQHGPVFGRREPWSVSLPIHIAAVRPKPGP